MIVTKRKSMASLIHDTSPILRHSLQQSHNKGLYYGFRDAILSRFVTIIKRLVNHAIYCISLSCLVLFMQSLYPLSKSFIYLSPFIFLLLLAVRVIEFNNKFLCFYINNNINYIKISLEAQ